MQTLDIGIIKAGKVEQLCSPLAWTIYQRTSSFWTHAVVFKNNKGDIWSADPGGILNQNINQYKGREVRIVRYKWYVDKEKIVDWINEKQAHCEGYDYTSLFGFLTGIKAFEDENRWYCSEVAYWMFQDNKYQLTNNDLTFVYPRFFLDCISFELKETLWGKK